MQTSQLQEPAGGLNRSPKPEEEEEGAVDTAEAGAGAGAGPGEFRAGEAKPGALRRSSTLPCFNTLAGLNGPSNSSDSSLADDFAAVVGVAILPLDTEGPVFATGALNVNPAEGEKEGGLAAVVMTMGEAKVKGTQGPGDAVGGALPGVTGSVATGTTGATVGVTGVAGGGEEKLNVGRLKVLIGREMAGRSGASATSSSGRLLDGRVLVRSLFILPPPEPELLAAGVLVDRGKGRLLVLSEGPATTSGPSGDCLAGGSRGVRGRPRPAGVREALKDMERFPAEEAAEGMTSLWTGGRGESLFLLPWRWDRSRMVPYGDVDRCEEAAEGILLASARGLDMRSRDCRMRRAVALVTPQGWAPAGFALICLLIGAW